MAKITPRGVRENLVRDCKMAVEFFGQFVKEWTDQLKLAQADLDDFNKRYPKKENKPCQK